jgi:hypothetical protein
MPTSSHQSTDSDSETPCVFCSSGSRRFWAKGLDNDEITKQPHWKLTVHYRGVQKAHECTIVSLVEPDAFYRRVQQDGFLWGNGSLIPKEAIYMIDGREEEGYTDAGD